VVQVDCTISIDDTGDLTISAQDTSANTDEATEINYIIDLIAPNIPSVSINAT
jgi:hypothetical protein